MTNIRAVFFDAGHTLIHARPSLGDVYARVTKRYGVDVDPSHFTDHFLHTFREYLAATTSTVGSDEQDRRMWNEITRKVYDLTPALRGISYDDWFRDLYDVFGRPESWQPYPDALDVLSRLRERGFITGVISNWDSRLRRILTGLGIRERIDHLFISSECGRRKPDRLMFDQAIDQAVIRCDEAVHVGDSYEEDIVGATNAGLRALYLRRDSAPPAPGGVHAITSLSEVLEIV